MLLLGYKAVPQSADCTPREAQSKAARDVLHLLLDKVNILPTDIKKDKDGRPFLADNPFAQFSISHSETHAFCLLSVSDGTLPSERVGLDAEPLDTARSETKCSALAKRFFTPNEQSQLLDAADIKRMFLEIFTKKEAFAKFTGLGLSKSLATLDTANNAFEDQHGVRFLSQTLAAHVVTVCIPASTLPDMRILSF